METSSKPADRRETLFQATLEREAATEAAGAKLAPFARAGDVIALEGELGTGKTVFARGFIRARLGADGLEAGAIPSPTFTLVQVYEAPSGDVWHFDLYRLAAPEEAWELGIDEAFGGAISLVEWPERLGDFLPLGALIVRLGYGDSPETRTLRILGDAEWARRLEGLTLA